MIKVSDFIVKHLVEKGIQHVFMITGGGAMHLNDSFGKTPGMQYFCNHHEQASAIAAESYARLTGKMAAVCVTTGPGGINAMTGVFGAWTDSIPMIIISGQVRYDTTVQSTGLGLRQLGDQEVDIIKCVESITKYSAMVIDGNEIKYHLDKAIFLATQGRPGPCWLDIPLNVQGAYIKEEELQTFSAAGDEAKCSNLEFANQVIERIKNAKRPVLLVGTGVRIAGAHATFLALVDKLNIPVVTAWNAHDCMEDAHRLYCGRPGTVGDRAGNFAVQNADLLLVLGCRLNIRQIGYDWESFAREAFKIVVDVDPLELEKPTVKVDFPIVDDLDHFMKSMLNGLKETLHGKEEWIAWCKKRQEKYPVVLPEYWTSDQVNPYCFIAELWKNLPDDQVVVAGNGSACVCSFQAAEIKKGQRLYTNSGCAAMGYDLPAAIGACVGGGKPIVCITGDGSMQMNIQELQTIVHHKLPIKIFVMNNLGYHSIRQTQENFFQGELIGCDFSSGISFPDLQKIAKAYEIPFFHVATHETMNDTIAAALRVEGPSLCEVMITPKQLFSPKAASLKLADGRMISKPLEDLFPFLEREEFLSNMLVSPLKQS